MLVTHDLAATRTQFAQDLIQKFPDTQFRLSARSHIALITSWTEGPTEQQVDHLRPSGLSLSYMRHIKPETVAAAVLTCWLQGNLVDPERHISDTVDADIHPDIQLVSHVLLQLTKPRQSIPWGGLDTTARRMQAAAALVTTVEQFGTVAVVAAGLDIEALVDLT